MIHPERVRKLNDRPWGERKIFGQVRYMNDAGLRRKFKIDDYVKKIVSVGATRRVAPTGLQNHEKAKGIK